MQKSVLVNKEEGILTLTLNKPEILNALDLNMREELLIALLDAAQDADTRVIILTGQGKAFCAGGDINSMGKDFAPGEGRARMQKVQKIIKAITGMDKIVVAAVNGVAAGAGCSLALACDFILAAEKAKFMATFGRVGLIPDLGSLYFLPRLIGLQKAKELIFTWRVLDAREAERIGLINRVVPLENLSAEAKKLAVQLAAGPFLANGLAKAIINKSLESTLDQILEDEAAAQDICFRTPDHKEGVCAFFEKRNPNFRQDINSLTLL